MVFAHKSFSACPLPSDDDSNANRDSAEVEDQVHEEENAGDDRITPSSADHLSVMYPPCQDRLLVKIYQGLPTLPYVAPFCFCIYCDG